MREADSASDCIGMLFLIASIPSPHPQVSQLTRAKLSSVYFISSEPPSDVAEQSH